jgi:hypothetical protein
MVMINASRDALWRCAPPEQLDRAAGRLHSQQPAAGAAPRHGGRSLRRRPAHPAQRPQRLVRRAGACVDGNSVENVDKAVQQVRR